MSRSTWAPPWPPAAESSSVSTSCQAVASQTQAWWWGMGGWVGGCLVPFCSPLALQVPPTEALEADDALSLALVGSPLPVAPPRGLEEHSRLHPL